MKRIARTGWIGILLVFFIAAANPIFAVLGPNIISDPGFEGQAASTVSSPWVLTGTGGIDRNLGFQHLGTKNGWVRSTSGWNKIAQVVTVSPKSNYILTGWIQSANVNTDGYFGVRLPNNGAIINEKKFGYYQNYTLVTIEFYTGTLTSIEVYGGLWGNSNNPWARFDDISLVKNDRPLSVKKRLFMIPGTWEIRPGQTFNTPTGLLKKLSDGIDKNIFEVVFVNYPASFGPIPGGAIDPLTALGNPSYVDSRNQGIDELIRLINQYDGKYGIVGYSQGAAVTALVGREHKPGGRLAHRVGDCIWVHTFGPPHRGKGRAFYQGNYADLPYEGISGDNIVNPPAEIGWYDFCFGWDMFGDTDLDGTYARQIYPLVTQISLRDPFDSAGDIIRTLQDPAWQAGIVEFVTNPPLAAAKLNKTIATVQNHISSGAHAKYDVWVIKDGLTPIQYSARYLNYWGARR